MHNHVIAGDRGYLPTYFSEHYIKGSEALEGLKEYVNSIIEDVATFKTIPDSDPNLHYVDQWYKTGVVNGVTGAADKENVFEVSFNRELASVDYAEIILCNELLECLADKN